MAKIERSNVIQDFVDRLRLNPGIENVPNQTGNFIVPTYDFSNIRYQNIVRNTTRTTTTAGSTIFTTDTNKEFYLCNVHLQNQTDATADNTQIRLQIKPFGEVTARDLVTFNKLTTTTYQESQTLSYNPPIKLATGSTISLVNSFTVGNSTTNITISGYEVDIS